MGREGGSAGGGGGSGRAEEEGRKGKRKSRESRQFLVHPRQALHVRFREGGWGGGDISASGNLAEAIEGEYSVLAQWKQTLSSLLFGRSWLRGERESGRGIHCEF